MAFMSGCIMINALRVFLIPWADPTAHLLP